MSLSNEQKLGAYQTTQRSEEDGRETDKRALLTCASRLKAALDAGGQDMATYVEAVRENQRLWTIFQVALCDPENQLSRDLKITLLNLSRYVDRVSFRAISEFAPQLLTSLIDINRTIAAGLARNPKAENPAASLAPPEAPPTSVMTSA